MVLGSVIVPVGVSSESSVLNGVYSPRMSWLYLLSLPSAIMFSRCRMLSFIFMRSACLIFPWILSRRSLMSLMHSAASTVPVSVLQ